MSIATAEAARWAALLAAVEELDLVPVATVVDANPNLVCVDVVEVS